MKILIIEPYYGGSHKYFLEHLMEKVPFDYELMTLPARKWKWRMRLAAPYFAAKLNKTNRYDRILCSSFLDVAAFKSIGPGWVGRTPILTYFHENQFEYPVQMEDERDFHFGLTNFTTALASDSIAFNSNYNRNSFLDGCRNLLKKVPDMKFLGDFEKIEKKSKVIYPGIDFKGIEEVNEDARPKVPVIIWNHRWEHDKNPELFFHTLYLLAKNGFDFKLVVLGKSYSRKPDIFEKVRKELSNHILHFGYVTSREEYFKWLRKGTVVVSTATHEFFGISVMEAVRAGCRPVLPNRLSYPELFPDEYLYDGGDFEKVLITQCVRKPLSSSEANDLTKHFSWDKLAGYYKNWLEMEIQEK